MKRLLIGFALLAGVANAQILYDSCNGIQSNQVLGVYCTLTFSYTFCNDACAGNTPWCVAHNFTPNGQSSFYRCVYTDNGVNSAPFNCEYSACLAGTAKNQHPQRPAVASVLPMKKPQPIESASFPASLLPQDGRMEKGGSVPFSAIEDSHVVVGEPDKRPSDRPAVLPVAYRPHVRKPKMASTRAAGF